MEKWRVLLDFFIQTCDSQQDIILSFWHTQLIYIAYNDNNNNTKQFIKINFLILVLPRLETVQSFGMSSTASITTIEIKNKKKNISIVFFIETIMLWPVTCNLQTSAIRGITRPGCRVVSKITKGVISGP